MLCVCLSDAELIEVIGGAHAEAGRVEEKKKKSLQLWTFSLLSTLPKNPPPSSYTNDTHSYTHTKLYAHLICDQTDAFNPWISLRLCMCVFAAKLRLCVGVLPSFANEYEGL